MTKAKPRTAKKHKLAKRITRWLTYDTIFALLPFGLSTLLLYMAGKLSINDFNKSPEILFFALMISTNSMRDINELPSKINSDIVFTICGSAFLLGAVCSAILYGSLLYESIIGPSFQNFRERLLLVSLGLSIVMYILGTIIQVIIGRIEEKP